MRFTVINHSCLFIETEAGTILVDPWLVGSAYWRSWWHFPPSAPVQPEWLHPDFVYVTHHHFDHFHYPSMRMLDRDAQVLIPRFGVDMMEGEVRGLGFRSVRELPHGRIIELGRGVRVASFQYGFDDTTFVVADGQDVLVDVNDCKVRGRPLRKIVDAFGPPTFVFKSYSFAQCYPLTYSAEDARDLELLTREAYVHDFIGRVREFRPRYAVPFGSMVAFLHPECRDLNRWLVAPVEVQAAARAAGIADTEVVVMAPGDTWDREHGFRIADVDWYTDRESHLDALAARVQHKLVDSADAEAGQVVDWDAFRTHFGRFVRALPPFVGGFACKRPVVFEVPSSVTPYWIVDLRRRGVARSSVPPEDTASIIRIPEAVLADAIEKQLVHYVHISMRIRVALRRGGVSSDLAFWGLLALFELGYLSPRTWLRPRFWGVAWRRRAEGRAALSALRGTGSFSERMASQFAEADDAGRVLTR